MNTAERIERLKTFIHGLLSPHINKPFEVSVDTFEAQAGLRVAEVGYWVPGKQKGTGVGASWMRSDNDAAAVILSCEEYLLWCDLEPAVYEGTVNGKYDPSIVDLAQETEQRVSQAVLGECADWIWRWPAGDTVPEGTEWYDDEKRQAYLRSVQS